MQIHKFQWNMVKHNDTRRGIPSQRQIMSAKAKQKIAKAPNSTPLPHESTWSTTERLLIWTLANAQAVLLRFLGRVLQCWNSGNSPTVSASGEQHQAGRGSVGQSHGTELSPPRTIGHPNCLTKIDQVLDSWWKPIIDLHQTTWNWTHPCIQYPNN